VNCGNSTELREKRLHEAVDQLTDENQSHLLGVLEALFHIQNEEWMVASELETVPRQ